MLATVGYITPEITGKFPGYLSPSAGLKLDSFERTSRPQSPWSPDGPVAYAGLPKILC